jgi:hypothetical protein
VIDEVLVTYPANTRLLEQREKIMKSLGREDKARAASVGGRIAEEQPSPPHEDTEPQLVAQSPASDPWTDVLAPRDTTFSPPPAPPEPPPAVRHAPWWQPVATQARNARYGVSEFIRDLPGRVSLYVFRLEQFTAGWLRRFSIPLKPRAVLVGVAAFAAVVLVVALVTTRTGPPSGINTVQKTAVPAMIPVAVQLSPASAQLFIDGKPMAAGAMRIDLSAGVHKFEARQPGYRAIAEEHEIQRPLTLALQLQAVPARLRLSTDDRDASIWLDGHERGVAAGGEFTAADIPAGEHTLEVAGQKGSGSFAFQVEPGRAPALSNPPSVKTAGLFVAATFSGTALLRSNISTAKLIIDGQPAGQLQDGILEVSLPPGEHEIAIQNEPASLMKVSAGEEPVVSASMWWIQQKVSVETRMKQAQALADQARYEDALRLVDEVLRENPQHEPARRLKTRLSEIIEALRKL